jgi:hypothetical protein
MLAIAALERKRMNTLRPDDPTPIPGDVPGVASIARAEVNRWVGLTENSPAAEPILKEYWASTGQPYPGPAVAWSGAFVNWVVSNSDTPHALLQSGAHIYYARKAYANRGLPGLYGAFKPDEVSIEPGDIIVSPRPGGSLTFNDIAHGTDFIPTHGDIVVGRSGNSLRVVGGNVNDTVSERVVDVSSPNIVAVLRLQHATPQV